MARKVVPSVSSQKNYKRVHAILKRSFSVVMYPNPLMQSRRRPRGPRGRLYIVCQVQAPNVVKIIDFGSAKDHRNPHVRGAGNANSRRTFTEYVGTPNFMAPEVLEEDPSCQFVILIVLRDLRVITILPFNLSVVAISIRPLLAFGVTHHWRKITLCLR